jgi:heat shock protein HtpX
MVTLTLIQGVVNTFVIFLARIIGGIVDSALRGNRDDGGGHGIGYFATVLVSELVLGLFASMIVAWFSRQREFRADAGGAYLTSPRSMIGALAALKRAHSPSALPQQFANFGINGGLARGMQRLFMSHPPLDERIAALEKGSGALSQAG